MINYKKIYANLSEKQKKNRLDYKKKRYQADKAYRDNLKKRSSNYRKNLSPEKKEGLKKYTRIKNRGYKKQVDEKFKLTGDPKIFLQYKRQKVKKGAYQRKIEFNLETQELLDMFNKQKGRCYYTGEKMVMKVLTGKQFTRKDHDEYKDYLTIDRLDSNKGYILNNVVLCTWKVNAAKSTLSYKDFIKICENIKNKMK
jgi:hypothetical protein